MGKPLKSHKFWVQCEGNYPKSILLGHLSLKTLGKTGSEQDILSRDSCFLIN